jgi:hypothetical protein
MGQRSSKMLISPIWEISLLRAWRVFFLLWVVSGHFFGFFPSVPIVVPKIPGVVIIKGPVIAHKGPVTALKKNIGPWTLILSILALLSKLW